MPTKKKKSTKKKKDLSETSRKNIWVLTFILVGLAMGTILGGVAFSLNTSEYDLEIIGMAIGERTAEQGAFKETFINLEEDTSRTMSYSTWKPDTHFSNFATNKMNPYAWDVDADFASYGVPNVQAQVLAEHIPVNANGQQEDEFILDHTPITLYDGEDVIEMDWYTTYVGSQVTINVHGDSDIGIFKYLGREWIGVGSTAEIYGRWNPKERSDGDREWLGLGVEFRVIIRQAIKTMMVGEASHDDPFTESHNTFLWTKVTGINSLVESTAQWQIESQTTGITTEGKIPLYKTAKDALLNQNAYSEANVHEFQLGDVMQDFVYIALDYSVLLGGDWETNTYDKALAPLKIQGWQITLDLTSCITTAYVQPFIGGEEQTTLTTNFFVDPELPQQDFWSRFTKFWKANKWLQWIVYIGVAVLLGYLFFQFLLPLILQARAAKQALGR